MVLWNVMLVQWHENMTIWISEFFLTQIFLPRKKSRSAHGNVLTGYFTHKFIFSDVIVHISLSFTQEKVKNNILFRSKGQESEHVKELYKYKAIVFPNDELTPQFSCNFVTMLDWSHGYFKVQLSLWLIAERSVFLISKSSKQHSAYQNKMWGPN